ncbi:MAG: hypothetical protein NZ518_05255, partial [Dehalococcoidia bacterium]|nr:hypothetical protein [Dehalococcoidia bacterium]
MPGRWRDHLRGLTLIAVLLAVQWLMATAGTGTLFLADARGTSTLYRSQADGFAAGSWHLPHTPPAALAALPDPYDPSARAGICALHDASYRDGRYALYFGPAPAVVMLL